MLESTEPLTAEQFRWMMKFTSPDDTSGHTVGVYRVYQALETGGAELDVLRAEVEEKIKKVERYETAKKLARELMTVIFDPRIPKKARTK